MTTTRYDLTYLSLGAGVQSSALLVMSNEGLYGCPRADVAIFADTQDEPDSVYSTLSALKSYSKIPIHVVTYGKLSEQYIAGKRPGRKGVSVIPYFIKNQDGTYGIGMRNCTEDFKGKPIEREARRLLGYKPRQRIKKRARALIGISLDEVQRMKDSFTPWITKEYPLIDARIRRDQCAQIVMDAGMPEPQKSACVFCPFHSDAAWLKMKTDYPNEFAKAVVVDKALRQGNKYGLRGDPYIHRTLKPLDEVEFKHQDQKRLDLFNEECEGMCGV